MKFSIRPVATSEETNITLHFFIQNATMYHPIARSFRLLHFRCIKVVIHPSDLKKSIIILICMTETKWMCQLELSHLTQPANCATEAIKYETLYKLKSALHMPVPYRNWTLFHYYTLHCIQSTMADCSVMGRVHMQFVFMHSCIHAAPPLTKVLH